MTAVRMVPGPQALPQAAAQLRPRCYAPLTSFALPGQQVRGDPEHRPTPRATRTPYGT